MNDTSEAEHTPGLIQVSKDMGIGRTITDSAGGLIGYCDAAHRSDQENEGNARRIAAAWNACLGIDIEDLELGLIPEMATLLRLLASDKRVPLDHAKQAFNAADRAEGRAPAFPGFPRAVVRDEDGVPISFPREPAAATNSDGTLDSDDPADEEEECACGAGDDADIHEGDCPRSIFYEDHLDAQDEDES